MKGFIYRLGTAIKDAGERLGRVPAARVFRGFVMRLGLAVRGLV
jgi:hypothetical protein